ncbi:MAG: hypothetical protein ACI8SK_000647, partial [Shewanella sp.]
YEDILKQCTRAWNDFIMEPKRVMKLCSREWIELIT